MKGQNWRGGLILPCCVVLGVSFDELVHVLCVMWPKQCVWVGWACFDVLWLDDFSRLIFYVFWGSKLYCLPSFMYLTL